MYRIMFLPLFGILLMGMTVSSNLGITVTQPAATGVCPMGSAYADGCANAPAGTPQYPNLLTKYGANRPPWNVAGVDYHLGIPQGTTLTRWETVFASCLNNPDYNCTVGDGTWMWDSRGYIRFLAGNATLDAVDFSGGPKGSFFISVPQGPTSSLSITRSNFGCGGVNNIGVQGDTSLVFKQNTADFSGCIGTGGGVGVGFIQYSYGCSTSSPCTVDIEYNFIRGTYAGPFMLSGVMTSVVHKYNLIESPTTCYQGAPLGYCHMNSLSWGAGSAANADISYNTEFSSIAYAGSAEFMQIYYNGGGSFTSPNVSNNTFAYSSTGCSYILHGSNGYSGPSTTVTNGKVNNNYFDATGCVGELYPGSWSTSLGWSASGNVNMVTGAAIAAQ